MKNRTIDRWTFAAVAALAASLALAPGAFAGDYMAGPVANGGTIMGKITLKGAPPKLDDREITKNPEVCGHGTRPSQEVVMGDAGALVNVVVGIDAIAKGKAFGDDMMSPVLDQHGCEYVPHVQVAAVGAKLTVKNSDTVLHNVHAYIGGEETLFNVAMPLKDQQIPKKLKQPGMVHIKCDAGHTWMSGYIIVRENPYGAVTGKDGAFSLADVPAGTYKITAWHELFGSITKDVTVPAGGKVTVDFSFDPSMRAETAQAGGSQG